MNGRGRMCVRRCFFFSAVSSPFNPPLLYRRARVHTQLFQLLLSSTDPGSKLAAFPAIALFSLSTGPASKNYLLR